MILDTWFQCFEEGDGGSVLLRMSNDLGDGADHYTGDLTTALAKVVTDDHKIRTIPVS